MQFSESKFDKMTTQYNGKWNFRTVWGLLYTVYFEIIEDVNNSVLGFVSFAGKELKLWLSGTGEFWKFTSINVKYTFVKRRSCYHWYFNNCRIFCRLMPRELWWRPSRIILWSFRWFSKLFQSAFVQDCVIRFLTCLHNFIDSLTHAVKFCRRVCWHTVFKDKM